jgi:murein DD-endopeptidase MepM/ murein hydrolase activator NlpD
MSEENLINVNHLRPPFLLVAGQKLLVNVIANNDGSSPKIENQDGIEVQTLEENTGDENNGSSLGLDGLAHGTGALANGTMGAVGAATSTAGALSGGAQAPSTAPSSGETLSSVSSNFSWPVQGKILKAYAPKSTNAALKNDGINIAAPKGTPVIASSPGEVVYVGEVEGLGKTVVIKHPNKVATSYSHLDKITVKKGSPIEQGDKIAEVGKSGGVSQSQLHFQVREGTTTIDPTTVLE